jgi:hypothetical protein
MWTFLLDPETQGVALVGVLCALGWVAFDLVQEVRAPSPADRTGLRPGRRSARAEAHPLRPAVGPMMETWTDAAGETRGKIHRGPCARQRLEDLSREDCEAQAAYARAHDPGSAANLEAYIRRRFAAPPPVREDGAMSRAQALRELGLGAGPSAGDIHAAWVKMIKLHHPDHGGSHAKAARINQARDALTG